MHSILLQEAVPNRTRNAWICWKCLGNRHKPKLSATSALRIPAVPPKPLFAKVNPPILPKGTVTSTDQNKLRRLPSFATFLKPATDPNATEYARSTQSTLQYTPLHTQVKSESLGETPQREASQHEIIVRSDSNTTSECERKNLCLSGRNDDSGKTSNPIDPMRTSGDTSKLYGQIQPPLGEHSELLDAISPRSNRPDISNPLAESRDCVHIETNGSDVSVSIGHSIPGDNAAYPKPDSLCERQTTSGQDSEHPEWDQFSISNKSPLPNNHSLSRQPQATSSGTEGLTIPETPNASRETYDAGSGSPGIADCMPGIVTPDLTIGSLAAAQSSLVSMLSESDNTKSDILSMRASAKYPEPPTPSSRDVFQHSQHVDQLALRFSCERDPSCSAELDKISEASINHHSLDDTLGKRTMPNTGLPEDLVSFQESDCVIGDVVPLAQTLPTRSDNASTTDRDVEVGRKRTFESTVADWQPTTLCLDEPCNNVTLPHRMGAEDNPASGIASEPQSRKSFTNRERARIALVASNGQRRTTAEIIDWNLQMFPYLSEKRAAFEKSIAAVLSDSSEFKGRRIFGVQGNELSWGFPSSDIQRRFEREYPEYRTSLNNLTEQGDDCVQVALSDGSDSTTKQKTSMRFQPTKVASSNLINEAAIPANFEMMHEDGPLAELKGRDTSSSAPSGTCNSPRTLRLDQSNGGRNFEACSSYRTPPLEAMTQTEIDQKISEIKQRPSRKKFFGPEHRLAHVRRYGRQDIHDESDGSWKPELYGKVKTSADSQSPDVGPDDREEIATVRQLFDLPINAIPMNTGQTELAFRDGTLVSILGFNPYVLKHKCTNLEQQIGGKLPRPRHIHKVGKMFGGELTIRTS
jgi:hypothetical protein